MGFVSLTGFSRGAPRCSRRAEGGRPSSEDLTAYSRSRSGRRTPARQHQLCLLHRLSAKQGSAALSQGGSDPRKGHSSDASRGGGHGPLSSPPPCPRGTLDMSGPVLAQFSQLDMEEDGEVGLEDPSRSSHPSCSVHKEHAEEAEAQDGRGPGRAIITHGNRPSSQVKGTAAGEGVCPPLL